MKEKNCNLCKSDQYSVMYRLNRMGFNLRIVKCKRCGFVYLNPKPTAVGIKKLYNEAYFKGEGFDKGVNYVENLKYKKGIDFINQDRLKNIEKFANKEKILDIGCGFGEFLDVAKKRGWDAYGIELSKFASDVAKKNFKLNVFKGTLEQAKYPAETFDVATMFEVIEHLTDPVHILKECNRILKKKGIIIIQTGNVESISAKLYGKRWPYFLAGHLHYFSKKTLSKMLEKADFKLIKVYNGDEISFKKFHALFWILHKNKQSITSWINYFKRMIFLFIRKLGFGGMTIYARKI